MHEDRGKPYVRRLSKHFVRRWTERVGSAPSLAAVNRMLGESHKLNGQRRIWVPKPGGGLRPDKQLAQFWHRSGLIIRVDFDDATAVTVITPNG